MGLGFMLGFVPLFPKKIAIKIIPSTLVSLIKCSSSKVQMYRMFQKFVPIVNFILTKAFNTFLGKCKLIQVRNLPK